MCFICNNLKCLCLINIYVKSLYLCKLWMQNMFYIHWKNRTLEHVYIFKSIRIIYVQLFFLFFFHSNQHKKVYCMLNLLTHMYLCIMNFYVLFNFYKKKQNFRLKPLNELRSEIYTWYVFKHNKETKSSTKKQLYNT